MKSHTLTVAELPAHSHGRGTQDITGNLGYVGDQWFLTYTTGCFSKVAQSSEKGTETKSITKTGGNKQAHFQASSNWSGTSESIGSGTSISLLNPYKVAYCFIRLS